METTALPSATAAVARRPLVIAQAGRVVGLGVALGIAGQWLFGVTPLEAAAARGDFR